MASPPLVFLLLFCFLSGGDADLASDEAALLAFRAAVARSALRTWNASDPGAPCTWQGVGCERSRVVSLRLPGAGLLGPIPAALGNLTALRTVSLRFNALSGPLPAELAGLAELRSLYLQGNRLSGGIPDFVASWSNLVRFNLADNQFSGGIPLGLNNLTRLSTLYLEKNNLTGEISALDLGSVVQFNVSYNHLNGSIPVRLRSQPASAFIGTALCGGPLGLCPGEIAPSPSTPAPAPASGRPGGGTEINNNRKKNKLSGGAIAGIAIGASAFLLIALAALILLCRRRRARSLDATAATGRKGAETVAGEQRSRGLEEGGGGGGRNGSAAAAKGSSSESSGAKKLVFLGGDAARRFDLEDLLRASAEVLGKGTFGTAYKAVLETGSTVTVKRLKDVSLPEPEFMERIEAIAAMDHPNLVPLMAYYFSKEEKLLVYEYMPMGSLSALLHGNRGSGRTPLSWETRTAIALSAAYGIEYIHSTSPSSSHGNIKSSNVLLTKSYSARVSDHGLAFIVGSNATASRVAGYRAPEVTDPRKVSQKADVYSFGVLLLELLTGKAPTQAAIDEEPIDLPRWVQSVVREEWTAEVFDVELLRYQNVEEDMVQLLQLAIDCVAQYPDKRPPMSDVAVRIDEIRKSSLGSSYRDQHEHDTPRSLEEDDHSTKQVDAADAE